MRQEPWTLPEGWRWELLGSVCTINPRRPSGFHRDPDAPTTFVPMAAVDEETGTIASPQVVPYHQVANGYTFFQEGDVLFAKITPCMQNGKHAIARGLIDGVGFGSTEFHILLPHRGKVLPEWVWLFIRQPSFLKEAEAHFTGSVGQQRVPAEFLKRHLIPVPPLQVQERMLAEILPKLETLHKLKKALQRQLEAVNALPQAYLRKAFRGEL